MRISFPWMVTGLLLSACARTFAAQPPSIEAFARAPAIADVHVSAQGRYLSMIAEIGDEHAVVVQDRVKGGPARPVLWIKQTDNFDVTTCGWANDSRLLCAFRGVDRMRRSTSGDSFSHIAEREIRFAETRLVAVNADGKDMKVLVQNSFAAVAQFQDRVLDWKQDAEGKVLLQLDNDGDTYPSVFELNTYTGKLTLFTGAAPPITSFYSDGRGQIRLAGGAKEKGTHISYFGRRVGETEWRLLSGFEAFGRPATLMPVGVVPGENRVLAMGESRGRQALWEFDLEDKTPPRVVFEDAKADLAGPILDGDGRLLGVYYETDRPHAYYTDPRAKSVIEGTNQYLADTYNTIYDQTSDQKVYVIRTYSDVAAPAFHVLDVSTGKGELQYLGSAYPELGEAPAAEDEVHRIQGSRWHPDSRLSHRSGGRRREEPAAGRAASWRPDRARFLGIRLAAAVHRQPGLRGAADEFPQLRGYGWEWAHAAHQDWGGLTYDDIIDGTRWAVASGLASPARICVVGASFGGYAAMLAAARNGDLFKCAASISGVSDLHEDTS